MNDSLREGTDNTVKFRLTWTKRLKKEVEKRAGNNGETVSEYLQKAAVSLMRKK